MSEVEVIAQATIEQRAVLAQLAERVEAADASTAADALTRIHLAREWARIQDQLEAMRFDLLYVEAIALRRIGRLGAEKAVLKGNNKRAIARALASLSDESLRSMIKNHGRNSFSSTYNAWRDTQNFSDDSERARRWARGERGQYPGWHEDEASSSAIRVEPRAEIHAEDVQDALALLLEEGVGRGWFTIDELAEELLAKLQINDRYDGFREGVMEVVRHAIRTAKPAGLPEGMPRFVTCEHPESGGWVRVPAEFATVGQYRQMLDLRRAQLGADQRVLDRLLAVGVELDIDSRPSDDRLIKQSTRAA